MKKIVLIGLLLFQFSALANDVIDYNGQKIVLIKIETAEKLDAVIKSSSQEVIKLKKIKAILELELVLTPGDANYCLTAEKLYNKNGDSTQNFFARCESALTTRDLIEELATDAPEYKDAQDLREMVSALLAFYLLM